MKIYFDFVNRFNWDFETKTWKDFKNFERDRRIKKQNHRMRRGSEWRTKCLGFWNSFKANHSPRQKMTVFYTCIYRALHICSDHSNLCTELIYLKSPAFSRVTTSLPLIKPWRNSMLLAVQFKFHRRQRWFWMDFRKLLAIALISVWHPVTMLPSLDKARQIFCNHQLL